MLLSVYLAAGRLLYPLQLAPGGFPRPLDPGEEQHYLQLAAAGDAEARNVLIEHNLRLVAHIMKKYYAQDSDQEDLISIGTIGLIKAVSTYRMDKNIRLATYASRCIENSILMPRNFFFQKKLEEKQGVKIGKSKRNAQSGCTSFQGRKILLKYIHICLL